MQLTEFSTSVYATVAQSNVQFIVSQQLSQMRAKYGSERRQRTRIGAVSEKKGGRQLVASLQHSLVDTATW